MTALLPEMNDEHQIHGSGEYSGVQRRDGGMIEGSGSGSAKVQRQGTSVNTTNLFMEY